MSKRSGYGKNTSPKGTKLARSRNLPHVEPSEEDTEPQRALLQNNYKTTGKRH